MDDPSSEDVFALLSLLERSSALKREEVGQEPWGKQRPSEAHAKFGTESLDRFGDWIRFADAKARAGLSSSALRCQTF